MEETASQSARTLSFGSPGTISRFPYNPWVFLISLSLPPSLDRPSASARLFDLLRSTNFGSNNILSVNVLSNSKRCPLPSCSTAVDVETPTSTHLSLVGRVILGSVAALSLDKEPSAALYFILMKYYVESHTHSTSICSYWSFVTPHCRFWDRRAGATPAERRKGHILLGRGPPTLCDPIGIG